MRHFVPENDYYVYFRYDDEKKIMVVLNNSEKEPKTIDLQRFSEMLSDVSRGRDILSGREIKDLHTAFTIPAKTAMVIELE